MGLEVSPEAKAEYAQQLRAEEAAWKARSGPVETRALPDDELSRKALRKRHRRPRRRRREAAGADAPAPAQAVPPGDAPPAS